MRLALVGAFPFPYPQGSQVFLAEQARALREAGAEPQIVSYGPGQARAAAIPSRGIPRWLVPRSKRSGPKLAKPFADAVLVRTLIAAVRQQPSDAILAHNVEALWVALAARSVLRIPVVYVAHTLWREELPSYGPPGLAALLRRLGAGIDRMAAQRADGLIALSRTSQSVFASHARREVALIRPGLALAAPPAAEEQTSACARHGLVRHRFALYSGNTDGYQDLELLVPALQALAPDQPLVIATHDPSGMPARLREARQTRVVRVTDFAHMRALGFAAGVHALPRKRAGGFPIKLLNAMETARPVVAFAQVAETLAPEAGELLLESHADGLAFGEQLRRALEQPALASALGRAARASLEREHAWRGLVRETLDYVARVLAQMRPS